MSMAEDYIPVTAGSSKLFAVFLNDPAVNLAFLPDTLVVVDYSDRLPGDGDFCLAHVRETPDNCAVGGRCRARLDPYSSEPGHETISMTPDITIIGCVRVSIRIH